MADTCIIYCRESEVSMLPTDVKFENQDEDCRADAQKKGYAVLKVLRESHSGADLIRRPLIWEAIEDIKAGRANVLLVWNWDRLARKSSHQGVILYEVEEKARGRVEAALEPEEDPIVVAIKAAIAEGERVHAVECMERGKVKRAARKELMGASNAKYGYTFVDDEPSKRTAYKENPETAEVVRRIFALATQGQSLRGIVSVLNADKIPTPSQVAQAGRHHVAVKWNPESVRRNLVDRAYIGEHVAYKWMRTRSGNDRVSHALRPVENNVSIPVPPLVDRATFDAVQKNLELREGAGRPPIDKEASWLRGYIHCGCCGSSSSPRRTKDGRIVFTCRNRCGTFGIRSHLLEPYALDGLVRSVKYLEPLRELMIKRLGTDKRERLVVMAESFQIQIAEKHTEMDNARRRAVKVQDDALAEAMLDDAQALAREIQQLQKDYSAARDELDRFNADNAHVDAIIDRLRQAVPDGEPTAEFIKARPYDERRLLLAASGLYLAIYPKNYRKDGKRVTVEYRWATDPVKNAPTVQSQRLLVRP